MCVKKASTQNEYRVIGLTLNPSVRVNPTDLFERGLTAACHAAAAVDPAPERDLEYILSILFSPSHFFKFR